MLDRDEIMDVQLAAFEGEEAAGALAAGGEPDLNALDRLAEALDVLQQGIAKGTMDAGWIRPTVDDVRAAQHLVKLVREGAPREQLREPAERVFRVTADPRALRALCVTLPSLVGEATDILSSEQILEGLDRAAVFFKRGGKVVDFVPTPEDMACLQRLRAIATGEGAEALSERRALVARFWARVPDDYVSKGIRRCA